MDTQRFKSQLEAEKARLEAELGTVGRINPENPADWEPTAEDMNVLQADENERADTITDFEERSAVEVELENRHKAVIDALARMEEGKYGTCKVCGNQIEEDRLGANPAAETCKAHMNA
jgi:RNA polymerase-binding transcription factor DksA